MWYTWHVFHYLRFPSLSVWAVYTFLSHRWCIIPWLSADGARSHLSTRWPTIRPPRKGHRHPAGSTWLQLISAQHLSAASFTTTKARFARRHRKRYLNLALSSNERVIQWMNHTRRLLNYILIKGGMKLIRKRRGPSLKLCSKLPWRVRFVWLCRRFNNKRDFQF